jgi:hypothetical protein
MSALPLLIGECLPSGEVLPYAAITGNPRT